MRARPFQCLRLAQVLLVILLSSSLFSQESSEQPAHLAVSVEGKVSIKRNGWSKYVPVVFGTSLSFGDLLQLEEHAKVKIVCSDLTLHEVESARAGVPCAASGSLLQRPDGSQINPTRAWTDDRSFPVVLSPRKTKLLSAHPLLRWTAVDGAAMYWVLVRGLGPDWAFRAGSVTETVYPDNAPSLKPGVDYKLIVETGGRSSSDEPGFGLGFSLLDEDARKTVFKEEKRIVNLGLSSEATEFLIAHLYSTHGLKAEAIDRLERLSAKFKAAAILRLLADLYLETGVVRRAETLYLEALARSTEENDADGEMLIHLTLANIYEKAIGNRNSAGEHLKKALALATQVGDDKTVKQTANHLAGLNGTVSSR